MDVRNVTPFLDAIGEVVPKLGFDNIKRGKISVSDNSKIASRGVMVVVGLTNELRGNIAYNMTEDSAKKIASTMMMGMALEAFDSMAESAIAELGNMLVANASMIFEQQGIKVDISPPAVITGQSYANTVSSAQRLVIEVFVDEIPMEVNVALAS